LDWWDISRDNVYGRVKKYPIGPAEAISQSGPSKTINESQLNIPSVEITFEMLENSIDTLQDWNKQSIPERGIYQRSLPGICLTYLKLLGLPPKIAEPLSKDIANGVEARESGSYPLILKSYKDVDVEMNLFRTMPMHMIFLGIEKSMISKTPIIVNRKIRGQNTFWYQLTDAMQASQSAINSISVSWCKSMGFSGKDKHTIGTASWQSEHYVAYTT